jgi:hypothetical protein
MALAALLAACGDDSDEVVVAGSDGDAITQPDGSDSDGSDSDGSDSDSSGSDGSDAADLPVEDGLTRTTSHPELVSAQKAPISDVATLNDQTIGVRFEGAAEPCSLANVIVTETDTSITVLLQTGLNPDAAAMTCIAQVFNYEILVTLEQPIGDREIILDTP